MAYDGRGNFIYDPPCGHFLLLRFIHCSYRGCDLHIATSQFNDQNSAGHLSHLYFNYSRHANVGADLHYLLRLPEVGIKLEPFPTAIIAFSINIGAYAAETVRASILAIPKGQWEASYAIGMNYTQAFVRTIMPQALRISVPSLSNTFISTVKDTSLASLVWIAELFRVAQTSQLKTTNLF